jgi:hypothetical protein
MGIVSGTFQYCRFTGLRKGARRARRGEGAGSAFPADAAQRIGRRLGVREEMLYDKLNAQPQ